MIGTYDHIQFPTETELSSQFGVSRSVTREAVKMLTAKGLLTSRPRQGTAVSDRLSWHLLDVDVLHWLMDGRFSAGLFKHMNEVCIGVEPEAAALAAQHAALHERDVIEKKLEDLRAAPCATNDWLEAEIAVRLEILRASNNPFFMQFGHLISWVLRHSDRIAREVGGRAAKLGEYVAVVNGIKRGDSAAARAAMRHVVG
ncbi:FadR/GntR family transcriptional regulator [Peristeroidobacter agariperforans]|uniref:FadR/GntR family transcriptional regulator n=1 Tax=Peristeroidobacter agariperforans TaxID=268404 RepID=UPI0018E4F0B1|nr:FCD domain-containing protein [Peristeroidobacter agariperforans]